MHGAPSLAIVQYKVNKEKKQVGKDGWDGNWSHWRW